MKIGIDARMYSSSFTGIGRYVFELTRHLFELDPVHEYVLFMNDPVFTAFTPPNPRVKKILVNALHYSWAEQLKFLFLLNRERLDLMHFTHFNAPLFYRGSSVVTIHDLTLSFFPGKKMTSWFHRLAYHLVLSRTVRRSRRVIAVSKNTEQDLQKLFHLPSSMIEVIYEGVGREFCVLPDRHGIDAVRLKFGIKNNYLLYTGVWRSHKNIVRLIEAFALLCQIPSFDGRLVLTGKEDPFYPEVKVAVEKLHLNGRVIFTGLVSENELISLYNGAALYVMPSLYEGFGLPVLEAMACGIPVACSRSSSLPEIAGEGNALFFDPLNTKEMAEMLWRGWMDEALRQRLRERGLERVRVFSWKSMAEATLKVYNDVIKKI